MSFRRGELDLVRNGLDSLIKAGVDGEINLNERTLALAETLRELLLPNDEIGVLQMTTPPAFKCPCCGRAFDPPVAQE